MARPIKRGLDYFPLDVNFLSDIKVRRIMRDCGERAVLILINLLCRIYEDEGYYIWWDDDMPFLIADFIGVREGSVDETVKKALQVNFFDVEKFNKYNILTSAGIQSRYLEATTKRKSIVLNREFLSINVNDVINRVNVTINSINEVDNEQSKEKESKVNESNIVEDAADKNTFNDDSVEIRLSKYLYSKILEIKANVKEPDYQKWATHIDLLIRTDKESPNTIKNVIDYATSDSFWKSNILSTSKLRKQFSRLEIQMNEKGSSNNNNSNKRTKYYKPDSKRDYSAEQESIRNIVNERNNKSNDAIKNYLKDKGITNG